MNRTQLVDALAELLGDRRTAAAAVDGLLDTIVEVVKSGDSVSLTGFGVFEGRARAARTARNPRTGEPVAVPATTVPAFRPGATFRAAVGGGGAPAPRRTPSRTARPGAASAPPGVAGEPGPVEVVEPSKRRSAEAGSAGGASAGAKFGSGKSRGGKSAGGKSGGGSPRDGEPGDAKPRSGKSGGKSGGKPGGKDRSAKAESTKKGKGKAKK